jgi:hypothetical protein
MNINFKNVTTGVLTLLLAGSIVAATKSIIDVEVLKKENSYIIKTMDEIKSDVKTVLRRLGKRKC